MNEKIIILPGSTDYNRGDQALILETGNIIKKIYNKPDIFIISDDEESVIQLEEEGYKRVNSILKHPSRGKNANNINYGIMIKIKWGIISIIDFIYSMIILNKLTRKLFSFCINKNDKETIELYKNCKACFVKGGGFIHDYKGGLIGFYTMYYQMFNLMLAQSFNKNIYIMPNSFGPLKGRMSKKLVEKVLKHCKIIYARESISANKKNNDLKIDLKLKPDLGFFLKGEFTNKINTVLKKENINFNKEKYVGITVRPYRFPNSLNPKKKYNEYIDTMTKMIKYLNNKGFIPLLISQTYSKTKHENDDICINEISNRLTQVKYKVIKDVSLNCKEIKEIYGKCTYVIGTRFHSVIFSLSQCVPSIAITYGGHKGDGIMKDIGLEDYKIPIEDLNIDNLIKTFKKLESNEKQVREVISNYINNLDKEYNSLIAEIKEGEYKKMKVTFFHDCRFKYNNGNYYFSGGLNDESLKFYTDIYGSIEIMARKEEISDTKELMRINNHNVKFNLLNNTNYIKIIKYERNKIKDAVIKSDICIIRLPSIIGNIAIEYANKFNKKCLVEVVGCPLNSLWYHSIKGKLLAPIAYTKLKKTLKHQKYVVYVTNEFLQKKYPTNGKQIGCSDVTLQKFDNLIFNERIKKISDKGKKKKIIIGTIGAIDVKYKGQEYVIKAISQLNKKGYNLKYEIIGGGNPKYINKIISKYKAEKYVEIIGEMEHAKIFNWLDNIDIYIQPSKTEGLCRSLIEAMSRAIPCIASNVGGNPELIDKEFTFKKGNVNQLSKKIINILKSDNMTKQAQINFERSKEYTKEKLHNKREDFYKKIIGEKND